MGHGASLYTLVAESDFSLASFLLSVLGEGSSIDLLSFLEHSAPDPVTQRICWLAMQDERRHVQDLQQAMDEGRQRRLARLGFPPGEAAALSALHTRNFI